MNDFYSDGRKHCACFWHIKATKWADRQFVFYKKTVEKLSAYLGTLWVVLPRSSASVMYTSTLVRRIVRKAETLMEISA